MNKHLDRISAELLDLAERAWRYPLRPLGPVFHIECRSCHEIFSVNGRDCSAYKDRTCGECWLKGMGDDI